MTRIALTDGSGAWFNSESAILFKEDTRFDGRNQISVPTGSQWEHQWLYYTKSGKWVLNEFSNYQGSLESYAQISEDEAVTWLIQNGYSTTDDLEGLPADTVASVLNGIEAAEI